MRPRRKCTVSLASGLWWHAELKEGPDSSWWLGDKMVYQGKGV